MYGSYAKYYYYYSNYNFLDILYRVMLRTHRQKCINSLTKDVFRTIWCMWKHTPAGHSPLHIDAFLSGSGHNNNKCLAIPINFHQWYVQTHNISQKITFGFWPTGITSLGIDGTVPINTPTKMLMQFLLVWKKKDEVSILFYFYYLITTCEAHL